MRTPKEREAIIREIHFDVVQRILREKSSLDLMAMPSAARNLWLKEKPGRIRALVDAALKPQGIAVDWQPGLPPYLCPHRDVPHMATKVRQAARVS